MNNDLIKSIYKQLNIPILPDTERICAAVYSVAGQMALASLGDYTENAESVSIQHFKKRISQIFDTYERIYPQIKFVFPGDKTSMIDDIYNIYLRTGFIYHSSHQLSPSVPLASFYDDLSYHRGYLPEKSLCMSGLGFYSTNISSSSRPISEIFGLQQQSFESYLHEMIDNGDWAKIVWPENAEFLRLDPPFSRGYWQTSPYIDGRISIARYGVPNKVYVFYQYCNGIYKHKQIPDWRLQDYFTNIKSNTGEYRRIAIALLMHYGNLPEIKVKTLNDAVEIKLGYRLPPSEEEFFKLFSWPIRYDFSSQSSEVFTRKMSKHVYPMFKHELETLGYNFVEE